MLIRCLNFSGNRTLFKTLLKQDLNLVQTRNLKLDFWNQPFGYLIKPPPGKSGSKEQEAWFHSWAKINFFIAGILLVRLIYRGELQESVDTIGFSSWWNGFFKVEQEKIKEKEVQLDEKSKELLRLVEKANKPFEPLVKLPDWPPPFVAKETKEVPEVPSKTTAQPALLVEETVPKNETS